MSNLTHSLLTKGHFLAVHNGQLRIDPKSGKSIQHDWFAHNSCRVMSELAQQLKSPIFSYSYYKTGNYNNGRSPGVMIRFVDLLTGDEAFALFNADLKRKRTSNGRNAGEPLPDGKFCIGRRSALCLLWLKTGLPLPKRFSEWHKSMSKLQRIYFRAERGASGKLSNQSITPLSLSNAEIIHLFGDNLATSQRQASDKTATRNGDKEQRQGMVTRNGDKHVSTGHAIKGLGYNSKCVSKQVRVSESAGELSACVSNCVQRNNVMTCEVVPLPPSNKIPEEQSNEEWLASYDSVS